MTLSLIWIYNKKLLFNKLKEILIFIRFLHKTSHIWDGNVCVLWNSVHNEEYISIGQDIWVKGWERVHHIWQLHYIWLYAGSSQLSGESSQRYPEDYSYNPRTSLTRFQSPVIDHYWCLWSITQIPGHRLRCLLATLQKITTFR